MKNISRPVKKLDSAAVTGGAPVYTEDLIKPPYLWVRIVRSPYAYAKIKAVHSERAMQVPGAACVLTHEDTPHVRHTMGGHNYGSSNPYDRYILEDTVRHIGDAAAIVAADTEEAARKMASLVKVDYEVLEPVLDMDTADRAKNAVHAEDDYECLERIHNDRARNILSHDTVSNGDMEAALAGCDVIEESDWHTQAVSQGMMETFRSYSYYDHNGKLTILSSTQIPFIVRRTAAYVFGLPIQQVRVIKPKVGGGFGAKQSLVTELFGAAVTIRTGKPALILYDRQESFIATTSRHEMKMHVKLGATKDGTVKAVGMYARENAGAYGDHSTGCVNLCGRKSIAMLARAEAYDFTYDIVYTNLLPGGAFRGYGATQGTFGMECAVNQLAHTLGIDPVEMRLKNIPKTGDLLHANYRETLKSTTLAECIKRGRELIGWNEKYPSYRVDEHTVRGLGMAVTMQGSGIAYSDKVAAKVRLETNGSYTVMNGAGDMGTGCDTILAQIAAEAMLTDMDHVTASGVDTDYSPYDKGSFASGTTYLTGTAVIEACKLLTKQIVAEAAGMLKLPEEALRFTGDGVEAADDPENRVSLEEIALRQITNPFCTGFEGFYSFTSTASPPPMMAGFAEIELDERTGRVRVTDYVGVIDCGTVINENLARVQAEGGLVQGIGMALYENVQRDDRGRFLNDSFLQYKIPSRLDVPEVRVFFEPSYEPSGPFGAKSIGEVVINTPAPAIQDAIYNAAGICLTELPFTPERVFTALLEKKRESGK